LCACIFLRRCGYVDNPRPGFSFLLETDLDPAAQEGCRTTQAT
jgi:hypothetical protein